MNLYEIKNNINEAIEAMLESVDEETGEVNEEAQKALTELNELLTDKLENCGAYMKNLRAEVKAIKEEEQNLKARRQSLENKLERLENYVAPFLKEIDGEKITSPRVALSIRHSKKVEVIDGDAVPAEFIRTKVEKNVDKVAAAKAMKNGEEIDGLALVDSESLQVK